MNIREFTKLKTEYKSIVISSALLFILLILLFVIEIFIFWGIYGEGATASRISELWYVEIILDYLPILIIGGYLGLKTYANYRKRKYIESKTNIITLLILVFLFLIRNEIQQLIF